MNEVLYEESAEPRNIKTQKAFFIIYTVLGWISLVGAVFFLLISGANMAVSLTPQGKESTL